MKKCTLLIILILITGCTKNDNLFLNKNPKTISYSESTKLKIINANNDTKKFTKTIKQYYYDKSNEEIIRLTALKKLQMELSKEVGEYISTNTIIKNSKIQSDEIINISSTLLNTKIIDEKNSVINDKFLLQITIESEVDTIELNKNIENILRIESNLDRLNQLKLENDKFLERLISLEISTKGYSDTSINEKLIKDKEIIDLEKFAFELALKNDYINAIKTMTKVISLNNENANAHFYRGYYLVKINDKEKAILDFQETIKYDPKNSNAYLNLANIYLEIKHDSIKAMEFINKAIAINPDHANAYHVKGNIFNSINSCSNAIENYNLAIKLEKNPVFLNSRAVCQIKIKDYSKAFDDLNQAIFLNPNYSTAYKNRGMLYYDLGNNVASIKDAKKACNLGNCKLQNLLMQKSIF